MDTDYGCAISFGDGGGDTGERDLADSRAPSSLISLDSRASERPLEQCSHLSSLCRSAKLLLMGAPLCASGCHVVPSFEQTVESW